MAQAVPPPFPESLCHRCAQCRLVTAARSVFLMCSDPALPKYVPQPVRSCVRFVSLTPIAGGTA